MESVKVYAGGDVGDWELLSVSGKSNCKALCESLERGELEHCVIELNICEDGCVNDPKTVGDPVFRFQKRGRVHRYMTELLQEYAENQLSVGSSFFRRLDEPNGAAAVARMLLEDCTHLKLFVGTANNTAHQQKGMSDIGRKLKVLDRLSELLESLGKEVSKYYY